MTQESRIVSHPIAASAAAVYAYAVVLRPAAATDAEFERDCGLVAQDLKTLGQIVERSARG